MRRFLVAGIAWAPVAASAAQAAPELSISDRLQDRRYIASSERAYAVGFEDGRTYRTTVDARDAPVTSLVLGHTLPRGSQVQDVLLDGGSVDYDTVLTNRGLEVLVPASGSDAHDLVVMRRQP